MPSLKELVKKQDLLSGGHRACAGCGATIAVRQILLSAQYPVVVGASTGCLEVVTTIFPYTAWKIPFIHSAFENVAATIAGVETGYRALKEKGKIEREMRFIAFGGDGGTYDIGLQALSGALERGHRMLYVCYNNQAYMNTGIQRSSATPYCAHTTTSPAGKKIPGKPQFRKNLTEIVIAHDIPFAAQASIAYWNDLAKKVQKALEVDGPSFINVLSVCPLGWGDPPDRTIEIARLAVETCFWPLYEFEDGRYTINRKPREKKPIEEFLKVQNRFRHIFRHPEKERIIQRIQNEIDRRWERLLKRAE